MSRNQRFLFITVMFRHKSYFYIFLFFIRIFLDNSKLLSCANGQSEKRNILIVATNFGKTRFA